MNYIAFSLVCWLGIIGGFFISACLVVFGVLFACPPMFCFAPFGLALSMTYATRWVYPEGVCNE